MKPKGIAEPGAFDEFLGSPLYFRPEPRSPGALNPFGTLTFSEGSICEGPKNDLKCVCWQKLISNLKSIDDGKGVLKHDGGFVYGKKAKNPANAQNWHQHKQTLDSSSGETCELKISFDLLL